MADNAWKQAERRIAKSLNGTRDPNDGTGKPDIKHPILAPEVKHGEQVPKMLVDALTQARKNAPEGTIPCVILHPKGAHSSIGAVTAKELAEMCPDAVVLMDIRNIKDVLGEAETSPD